MRVLQTPTPRMRKIDYNKQRHAKEEASHALEGSPCESGMMLWLIY